MKLPDAGAAWADWLVYADYLSEQGDLRGELLVLDRQWAQDPDNEALRVAMEAGVDAWLARWEDDLWEDDAIMLEELLAFTRELRRFGPTVPRDFAVLQNYPKSQLLAAFDLQDRKQVPPSPVLHNYRDDVFQGLIRWIEQAFEGVPVPDEAHRTLYQAEAWDNYEHCDRSRDHLGRWQDLPEQHLLDCEWSLSYLDEQGIAYYLPAIMCFALRYRFETPDAWLSESLGYMLTPTGSLLERFEVLTWRQRIAVCAFTLASENTDTFTAWIRVIEAEKEGAREDWLTIWSQPSIDTPT